MIDESQLEQLAKLVSELRKLDDRDERPKQKDFWDKLAAVSTFAGGVLIAAVALVFTLVFDARQANRQHQIGELEVVAKFMPFLTGTDESAKKFAFTAINTLATTEVAAQLAVLNRSPGAGDAMIAIFTDPNISESSRTIAGDALKELRSVSPENIERFVKSQDASRVVDEVILHHTVVSSREHTGKDQAKWLAEWFRDAGVGTIGYHYVVSPDGTVWVGTPQSISGTHTKGRNESTVGVALMLNGGEELPSAEQARSTALLFMSLFEVFGLNAATNFRDGSGFHRDHVSATLCPGEKITKELVLSWIASLET